MHLNAVLKKSFYLPSAPSLVIDDTEITESSGEKLLRHLEYLSQGTDQILLLDEWDANLDVINIRKTEMLLNRLAKQKVILEVRHRSLKEGSALLTTDPQKTSEQRPKN